MKLRRRHVLPASILVALAGLALAGWWCVNRPEARARRLVAEYMGSPPSAMERLLRRAGLVAESPRVGEERWQDELIATGPAMTEAILELLGDPDVERRRGAAELLRDLAMRTGDAAPAAVVALQDTDSRVRDRAQQACYNMMGKARHVAPDLVGIVRDESKPIVVRAEAAHALVTVAPDVAVARVLDVLGEMSVGTDKLASYQAAHELMRLAWSLGTRDGRPDPPAAVRAALIRALARGSKHAQMEADGVLGYLAPRPDDAIGPLVSALDDPNAFTRTVAARALGDARASAPAARAALTRALADRDPDVRAAAAKALTTITSPTTTTAPSP